MSGFGNIRVSVCTARSCVTAELCVRAGIVCACDVGVAICATEYGLAISGGNAYSRGEVSVDQWGVIFKGVDRVADWGGGCATRGSSSEKSDLTVGSGVVCEWKEGGISVKSKSDRIARLRCSSAVSVSREGVRICWLSIGLWTAV